MLGFKRNDQLKMALANLQTEFGLSLAKLPDGKSVASTFKEMSTGRAFSDAASVALLYRLVAMNFLAACKLMRDGGHDTPPTKLLWLTNLLDRSVDWSERASDHIQLEQATSQLNINIKRFMASFGIHDASSIV